MFAVLSIVYAFVKLVFHTYELKIAHACLYGKNINGRVGIAAGDIRKPTSAGVLPQVLLFRGYCNCGLEGEIVYRS